MAELGCGAGGVVYKVTLHLTSSEVLPYTRTHSIQMHHKATGEVLARKLIRLVDDRKVRKRIIKELEILHMCSDPHVIGNWNRLLCEIYSTQMEIIFRLLWCVYQRGGLVDLHGVYGQRLP